MVLWRGAKATWLALLCLANPVLAQQGGADTFRAADAAFTRLPLERRLQAQLFLSATGYWLAVPNVSFSQRLFNALRQFQRENGLPDTGMVDEEHIARLEGNAGSFLRQWGFQSINFPGRPYTLWIPFGLGLSVSRVDDGVRWARNGNEVIIRFDRKPTIALEDAYQIFQRVLREMQAKINYGVLRKDFFVISASGSNGLDHYYRYHLKNGEIIGFSVTWQNSSSHLHMERVVTIMSGSLWSSMTGAPFPSVPSFIRPPEIASSRPETSPASAAPTPRPTPVPEPKGPSSGSGFFVSSTGHILSNAHVVKDCRQVTVTSEAGAPLTARIVARDTNNDLALLHVVHTPKKIAAFKTGIRMGEQVAVFGFPLSDLLSSSGNFTLGNVTALAGSGDDSRYLQISAPVQAGNSGGPLFDQFGNAVGVVTAKLDDLKMLVTKGDVPQNVNFALKASVATNFMESNNVTPAQGQANAAMQPADLADHARLSSVFIRCE